MFCIDVAGFEIMSNHYHLVLHVDQQHAHELSDEQVLNSWLQLYKGPALIQRCVNEETLTAEETDRVRQTIATWREELTNISRFMGHLNQTISMRANREDGCRGRFWESRFKLQAILDLQGPILERISYNLKSWQKAQKPVGRWFSRALGGPETIDAYCDAVGQYWIWHREST